MKTLRELKGKTITAVKSTTCDEKWQAEKIAMTIRNLQPCYYADTNAIEIESTELKNGKFNITIKCADFIAYSINKGDSVEIEKSSKSLMVEYIENINRYKMVVKDFLFTFEFPVPIYEQVQGMITFRAGGDYVFEGSYGDKIKADELTKTPSGTIVGFTKRTYASEKIEYKFI